MSTIITITLLFAYILLGHLSTPTHLAGPWHSKRDARRICLPYVGNRIGLEDFDRYQTGSKDISVEDAHWEGDDENLIQQYAKSAKMIDTERLLLGPPTPHFKDNLRPELKYITGWYEGGFTNQFMGVTHLLFLSKITPHHIPIVPPFVSRPHLPLRAGMRDVSAIFDLERWARSIDKRVVEWRDVKDIRGLKGLKASDQGPKADELDEIGCWSIWATANLKEGKHNTASHLPGYLNLDISYTPIPREARLYPHSNDADTHSSFNQLSVLAHSTPKNPNPLSSEKLKPPTPNKHKNAIPPDSHVTCYDFLYWLSSSHGFEWEMPYSSAWNLVGKYARWSDRIRALARTTLALTLGRKKRDVMWPAPGDEDWRADRDGFKFHSHDLQALDERDRVRTKYISIHARHGDFLKDCPRRKEKGLPCFPTLQEFEKFALEIEEELRRQGRLGGRGEEGRLPVIVTSDEMDEAWWKLVDEMGWKRIVFPKEELGVPADILAKVRDPQVEEDWGQQVYERLWDRMLVEMAIQSFGTGFIGTQGSTMSLVAARRVEHWQEGVTRMVKFSVWGDP